MLTAVLKSLRELGVRPERIHYEKLSF